MGNLPRRSTFLVALDTHGDGEGERHIKKSEKRENSSRAQRGCGLACGFNQLHKECEKYEEFGGGVGTPWCPVSLTLVERADESGERHRTCPSLVYTARVQTSSFMTWGLNVLGYRAVGRLDSELGTRR